MKRQLIKISTACIVLFLSGIISAVAHPVCTNEYCDDGECTYCGKDGQVPCSNESCTNGLIVCRSCLGWGSQDCSACAGSGSWYEWVEDGYYETVLIYDGYYETVWVEDGYEDCDEYGNNYWVDTSYEDEVWVDCSYWEDVWIDTSDYQWIVCSSCDGGGGEDCSGCFGTGLESCWICGGDDSIDCPICNGTGLCQAFAGIQTTGPAWWFSRDVILTNLPPLDYGAVNQGQLKHIAAQAWMEMSNVFYYATVSNIQTLVQTFDSSTNNFAPANIGQLKHVARPFYDVLIAVEYADVYPWTESAADDSDFHLANIGQVKSVFSFDLSFPGDSDGDGLPDLWELKYGFDRNDTNGVNGALGDTDFDDFVNVEEYLSGTDPRNEDHDGDGVLDGHDDFPLNLDEWIDTDGDGTGDNADTDDDNDQIPDTYEITYAGSPIAMDPAADMDDDGLSNLEEYQIGLLPDNEDYDGDGLKDGDELYGDGSHHDTDGYVTDPFDPDYDNDQMSDGYESCYGLNPLSDLDQLEDMDGDGYLNIYEYLHGQSNPGGPASVPIANIYVSVGGSHICPYNTLLTAATNIQAALDIATNAYDVVEVADGIYTGIGNVNLTFPSHPIILRSASGADGCIVDCENKANTRAVWFQNTQDEQTVLMGITIRNGNHDNGGGIRVDGASPTIRDCVIENCEANYGGGIYYYDADDAVLESSMIVSNSARSYHGGGVWMEVSVGMILQRCTFSQNVANQYSGGVSVQNSDDSRISDCIFSNNIASAYDGGGLHSWESERLLVERCEFKNNQARRYGGGMDLYRSENAVVEDCDFAGNVALGNHGGGLMVWESPDSEVSSCTAVGNSCVYYGGGISVEGAARTVLQNCIVMENSSGNRAGGVWVSSSDEARVVNCTVVDNTAGSLGGGLYLNNYNVHVTNTILWANSPDQVKAPGGSHTLSYSCVQGLGSVANVSAVSCITNNPCFDEDGWHLTELSPCIDAGVNSGAPIDDADGDARIDIASIPNRVSVDDFVDIGADEYADSDSDGMPDEWEEFYFGGATNAVADSDPDFDGFNNLEEFLAGSNPLNTLPYMDGFESDETDENYSLSTLNGQRFWTASGAFVTNAPVASGAQAATLTSAGAEMSRPFMNAADTLTYEFQLYLNEIGILPAEEDLPASATVLVCYDAMRGLQAYDGGSGWADVPGTLALGGQWVTVRIDQNFATQRWDLWVNGIEKLTGLNFKTSGAQLQSIHLENGGVGAVGFDELSVREAD